VRQEGDEAQSTNNIHMIYHYSKALFNAFQVFFAMVDEGKNYGNVGEK
jgi:hypothetical protein